MNQTQATAMVSGEARRRLLPTARRDPWLPSRPHPNPPAPPDRSLGTTSLLTSNDAWGATLERRPSPATVSATAKDATATAALALPPTLPVHLKVRQRWDGVVREVHEGYFVARLVPLGRDEPELFADILNEKVDDDQRDLIRPGALFYLVAGFIPISPGQRIQASKVRFRRLPQWRQEDVDYMREVARKRRASLGLDASS